MSPMVKSEYGAGTDLSPISDDENDAFKTTDDSLMTPSTKSTPASENSGPGYKGEKDKVEPIHDFKSTIEPEYDHATIPAKSVKQIKTKLEDVKRSPQLWLDAPSAKNAAALEFQEVVTCLYQSKDMGESGQEEIMSCDCRPEYHGDLNAACGPDSNCINRITSIECLDDECNCGEACQNQRFQRRQYASVDVIDAGLKGYGLRAMQDLHRGSFVYEYVGEVIGERKFRQRQREYKEKDEKHFYFMMLQKGEYIDATKKGGYGRFINHSCEPNCYVDKWVVGSKMRMGIFCKRHIVSGEELTFDYNVDRYGGEATPCYCGEPSCLGYIGGKTQTDAANKLPQNVAEALGIDDNDEIDDAPKRLRRKKGVDDEEYVNTLTPRAIAEHDVPKIMATLVLPTERWLLKKLLQRIASAEDDRIHSSIIRLHGYQTLGSKLEKYHDDAEIATLILSILHTWPRVTRNKISSSKIEQHVKGIAAADSMHESVKALATELLQIWGELKMAYRIPRRTAGHRPQHDVQLGSPSSSSRSETSPEPSASLHRPRARHSIPRWPPVIRPGVTDDLRRSQASRPSSASVPAQGELQAIIDAATRLQQEQAALAQAEAEKKESEETLRLAAEAKQRSERAHKHQLRKARKEEKAMRRIRPSGKGKERDCGHQSSSEKDAVTKASIATNSVAPTEDMSKTLERQFAKVVPNFVSKYQATLGKDEVKKRAREIVKILVAKELARPSPSLEAFSMEKLAKIKAYSKEFMHKLLARSAVKSADHSGGRTNAMTPADVSDGVSLKRDYDQFQTGQAEKAQECADGS